MSSWFDLAINGLADKSWCCLPGAFSKESTAPINAWLDFQIQNGALVQAGIGKGSRLKSDPSVRGDHVCWIPDEDHVQLRQLKSKIESLRLRLNSDLFAGLESFEGHFAVYPPGSFYRRHLDTFRDDDKRSITFILYLNSNWQVSHGGELGLEISEGIQIKIQPTLGTIVLFDSRKFPHEVLPALAERRSFTGWFKVRSLG